MSGQERKSLQGRPGVRRRQTLSSFPAKPTEEDKTPQQSWKKQSRCAPIASSFSSSESQEPAARPRRLQARFSGDGQTTTHLAHPATSVSGSSDTRGPHRRLGRTPSSPSVLLSKVKERIREKVRIIRYYQHTVETSHTNL